MTSPKTLSVCLVRDLVLLILEHVVGFGAEVQERPPHNVDHVLGGLEVRRLRLQPRSKKGERTYIRFHIFCQREFSTK